MPLDHRGSLLVFASLLLPACGTDPVAREPAATEQPPTFPTANAADAVASVLAAFDRASIVALGEEHRSHRCHEFLARLLADPQLPGKFDDLVVEFGNALHQPTIDRYVAGEDVPPADLRRLWRDTTQWLVWDSPLYQQFFARVRALNATLPQARRLRVVLADPPVDWARVQTGADFAPYAGRSADQARVVETEVLARGRKALLVMGGMHLLKGDPSGNRTRALDQLAVVERLERKHPGAVFTFWTVPGKALLQPPAASPLPRAVRVRGSGLEAASFGWVAPRGIQVRKLVDGKATWVPLAVSGWPPMAELADALLFLPADDRTVDPDVALYRDPAYATELRRRARILGEVYGFDFAAELDALLAK